MFLLRPPNLLRHGPFFERKNVCNSQEKGVRARCAAIANHPAVLKILCVVNLLRVVLSVRRGPLGGGCWLPIEILGLSTSVESIGGHLSPNNLERASRTVLKECRVLRFRLKKSVCWWPQAAFGIVQKVFSEKVSATTRMRQKCVQNESKMRQKCAKMGLVLLGKESDSVRVRFRVRFQAVKVPILGGFLVENPTKKANRRKALLRGISLSEYGLEGCRVRLRRLSEYGSIAYLLERPTRETRAGRTVQGHRPKEERSKMRQKCVKNARNTLGGERLLDDTEALAWGITGNTCAEMADRLGRE